MFSAEFLHRNHHFYAETPLSFRIIIIEISYADLFEILEPQELRDEIKEREMFNQI